MMSKWDGFEEAVAVADMRSFAAAARRLGVSTSHVSRAVARLEDRVGALLFSRTTRSVILTDAGRIVAEQIRQILQERDEIFAFGSDQRLRGDVRMTCSTSLGERFVAPIVRRFAEAHSGISIQLELTNRVIDLIAEGFDLGIRTGIIKDDRLERVLVASRGLHLCAAPSYLARAGTPRSIDELAAHECVVASDRSWPFNVAGETRLFHPTGRWQCNNAAALRDACLAGMGICQLPHDYVADAIHSGALVLLLDECRPDDEPVWAVYPRRRHLLPKIHLLIEMMRAELQTVLAKHR
jgi:DNA-binding transcriptional LysR family regulator